MGKRRIPVAVNIGTAVVFVWFLFQVIYYSISIQPGIAPDEYYHLMLCESILKTPGISVKDTPHTASLGPVSTRPYLYHLVMGKALHLKPDGISGLGLLRGLNVILAVFTFLGAIRLVRLLAPENHLTQLAALMVMSNVTMFVFLSGMLSYDNLVNLISVLSFFFVFRYIGTKDPVQLFIFIPVTLLGLLTKETYILVALVQLVLLLFAVGMPRHHEPGNPRSGKKIIISLGLVSLVLLALTVRLYGGNYLKYGSFIPGCEQVFSDEECRKTQKYRRDQELLATVSERQKMHPLRYGKQWLQHMEATSLGIMGHKVLIRTNAELLPFNILLVLSLALLALGIRQGSVPGTVLLSLVGSAMFVIAHFVVNYLIYDRYRVFELAVHGRYLFPILIPLSVALCHPLLSRGRKTANTLMLAVLTALFVMNGFVWFLVNADGRWYG